MPTALRETLLLVCGILLGIVAGAAIILFLDLAPEPAADKPAAAAPAPANAPATARMGAGAAPTAAAPPAPATQHVSCPVRPLLAAAGAKDGQLLPPADVAGKGIEEAERLLSSGKEAAAAGQVRDAEVAYLTSCRIADARKGGGSVEAATARYQLARHYVAVSSAEGNVPPAEREALRGRARAYYEDSLQTFRGTVGPAHEKTRFAAEGLAALQPPAQQQAQQQAQPPASQQGQQQAQQPTAQPGQQQAQQPTQQPGQQTQQAQQAAQPGGQQQARSAAAPGPGSGPTAASPGRSDARAPATASAPPARVPPRGREPAASGERQAVEVPTVRQATGNPGVPAAPPPPPPEPGDPSAARPSFDCARARSVPEKIICGDSELSRLDRELGRLHARARLAAPDASAFKRQNDEEWRRRESACRTRECLVDWYAERRRQLQAELSAAGRPTQDTAAR